MFRSGSSEMSGVRTHVQELVRIADETQDRDMILQASHALWTTDAIAGDWEACRTTAEEGLALYDEARHAEHKFLYGAHDPGACCLGFLGQSLWMLGQASDFSGKLLDSGVSFCMLGQASELSHLSPVDQSK